jgi:hypothetical protein
MIVLGAKDVTTIIYRFICDVAEWALIHDHQTTFMRDRRMLNAIHRKRRWLDAEIDVTDLAIAQAEAEVVWREIWQTQNASGGVPVTSPFSTIVTWATRPTTTNATNPQIQATVEARRVRQMLTNAITPQSDLNAEFERRLMEAFLETGSA